MALTGDFSLQDAINLFSTNSVPNPESLKETWLTIVDQDGESNSNVNGGKLSDFENMDQPSGTTNDATNIEHDKATLHGSVNYNNVTTHLAVRFRWTDDDQTLVTNWNTTSWSFGGDTTPSVTITGLAENTQHYFTIEYYNGFVKDDPYFASSKGFQTEVEFVCSPPASVGLLEDGNGQWKVNWTAPSDGSANSYNIYRRVDGNDTLMASEVGIGASPYNINDPCSYGSTGDTFLMIVQSNCSGGGTASGFSNQFTLDCQGGEHQQ